MGDDATQQQQPLTREEVRAELQRVVTDEKHPHHEGYAKGWTTADKYVADLYSRIPGGDAKIDTDNVVVADAPRVASVGGAKSAADGEADVDFRASVASAIVERYGSDAKALLTDAQAEGERLFDGKDGGALLDLLDSRMVMGFAPQAERDAHVPHDQLPR